MNPVAPLDDPLSYPGPRAEGPFRLHDDQVEPLTGPPPLGRHAVLAIGSNACPAQLAAKFRGRQFMNDLVGLPVQVTGLQIRPSAHLGRSGYWPFAPAALDDRATSTAVLCLLDDEQLAVLDATEPNYDRIHLDPTRHRLAGALAGMDRVLDGPVELYASRHGVVDDARLPGWSDPPPTQRALLTALLPLLRASSEPGLVPALEPGLVAALADAPTLSSALRAQPGLAARLTEVLRRTVRIVPDGLR